MTFLLVHGAWHGSWCWEQVASRLTASGAAVQTVDLPSAGTPAGLHDDARVVQAAIDSLDGPVTVVAHSYGGQPVTEAAAGVAHIVYVAAFQLDEGDSVLGAIGGQPPSWWKVDGDFVTPLTPAEVFFNDIPDSADAVAQLRPQGYASFTEPLAAAAWKTVPSTYVVCDNDNAIPVFAQEAMSQRSSRVERLSAGHSPFLSRPDELVRILLESRTAAVRDHG
jgi:pimeloyl-ACP methyl ester carboxylesterase